MCGIVGFTGAAQAAPILLDGLAKLEYRGYDSAGMAVQNAAGKIEVVKAKGRLKVLSEMTDGGRPWRIHWNAETAPAAARENPSVFREEFYGFLYQYGNVIL